ERATGEAAPDGAGAMLDRVRADIEAKAGPQLDALALAVDDQAAFGARLKDLLRALDLDAGDADTPDSSEEPGEDDPDQAQQDQPEPDEQEEEDGGEGGQSLEGSADDQSADDERQARPDGAPGEPEGEGTEDGPEMSEGAEPNRKQTADD